MTSAARNRLRPNLAAAARAIAGGGILVAGISAAGVFTSSAPAAPQDCLPVAGCVTTTLPTVSLPVTLPTVPTLPVTVTVTTTTVGSTTTSSTVTTTGSPASPALPSEETTSSQGAQLFSPKATIRVRGRGARRTVEIRVNLTKAARLNAVLSRNRGSLAKRSFNAKTGTHLFKLRIGRTARPGLANLSLVYRATTGEAARTTHRLRLPR